MTSDKDVLKMKKMG